MTEKKLTISYVPPIQNEAIGREQEKQFDGETEKCIPQLQCFKISAPPFEKETKPTL